MAQRKSIPELKETADIRTRFKVFVDSLGEIELRELAERLANNLPDGTLEIIMETFTTTEMGHEDL